MGAPGTSKGPWRIRIHTGDGKTIVPASDCTIEDADGRHLCFEGRSELGIKLESGDMLRSALALARGETPVTGGGK